MHIQALAVVFIACVCYQSAVHLVPETIADTSAEQASSHGLKVLYVLECEGHAEWQDVPAEDPVVAWVQQLTDRLTLHTGRPDGEDLTVSSGANYPALCTSRTPCLTAVLCPCLPERRSVIRTKSC